MMLIDPVNSNMAKKISISPINFSTYPKYGRNFAANFRNNLPDNFTIRNTGSAALDLAYVAAGRYDGSFEKNVHLWDISAGVILVKEAGGMIDEVNLKKFNNISLKATNETIYSQVNKEFSMF